ncbi:MAG: bifunctional alpha,alpha-trehalose-phosphate synthase (UDP-forming)/trehalose-phosphatase [Phycisphaerae bacterium]|nr:bifunctional alpha,alpha-trehalose-phosphate synthase (UDP-forming)/trehalose-phosphatase [Phycisphaerae bacterium]
MTGFSNNTIWPLFHYFTEYTVFERDYWEAYKKVNQMFCDELIEHIDESDTLWIHDYQLLLLPRMIREKIPNARIGFFLHIPFPSFELIRYLPWREEILAGMLGADLIGFHEYDYVRHFLSSVRRICGYEHNLSTFVVENRKIRVDAFPMGIDYDRYADSAKAPEVKEKIQLFNNNDCKIIISVDRLDYTKGIFRRLEAYDWFLTRYPEYRGKVSLVTIAVPSRTTVEQYELLREEIERLVSRINGNYGTLDWTPVSYLYRGLPFEELTALYHVADVALITPLRDGMNLVAKEFVAAQHHNDQQGILILSEMAGAASELSEAIIVNPHHKEQVVNAIKQALEMPQEERRRRNGLIRSRISRYTISRWANDFFESLNDIKLQQDEQATKTFSGQLQEKTISEYTKAESRLLLLDYDGTLVPFAKLPEQAQPDPEIISVLKLLSENPKNEVVVISGRDKDTLHRWLGHLPLHLVAEHGSFFRFNSGDWKASIHGEEEWKGMIRPILDLYADRTAGSFVEEKESALVWHFRKSEPDLAKLRTQELKDALIMMTTNLNIGVHEGNKIVEVKSISINKGQAIRPWLEKRNWPFIFCFGDDYTDEDMFAVLPDSAVSCKIGSGPSNAKFRLGSPEHLRKFLSALSQWNG